MLRTKSVSRICSGCGISTGSYRRRRYNCRLGIGASDLFLFKAALGLRIHLHLRPHGTAKLRATDARRNDSPDRVRTPQVSALDLYRSLRAAETDIGRPDLRL